MGTSLKGGTTVKQTNEPPKWAAPLFEQSAGIAQNLYDSNAGFNIWPGSTVAEPSAMTQAGAQGLADVATSPDSWGLSQYPVQLTNQVISQGGLMSPAQEAMSFFGNVAEGQYNPSLQPFYGTSRSINQFGTTANQWFDPFRTGQFGIDASGFDPFRTGEISIDGSAYNPFISGDRGINTSGFDPFRTGQIGINTSIFDQLMGQALGSGAPSNEFFSDTMGGKNSIRTGQDFRDIYGRAQQPGAAENYLTETARGDYLAEGNPHFRQWLEREAERLGDQVSGQFSAAGRYGSGAHQGVLGDTVGDFTLQGLAEDFNRERGLQLQAAQTIEDAQQGRLGQQLGAVSGITGVQGQNLANRMAAAGQLNANDLARLGLAGQFASTGAGFEAQNIANMLGATQAQTGFDAQNIANQLAAIQQSTGLDAQNIANMLGATGAQTAFDAQNITNQLGAAQSQADIGQTILALRQALAGDIFGANQQNFQNQFGGAQEAAGLSNLGLQNALGFMGALPTIQQNRTFAPQLQMQAGAVQDQYNQQLINDMISQFYQQDMQPWTRLGALQAAAAGAAGPYGMAYQKQQENSGLLGILGDVASIFAGMPAG